MGFFGNAFSSLVKVALTPVAIVKDAVNVATGEEANATKEHIESTVEDAGDAMDDLAEGEL